MQAWGSVHKTMPCSLNIWLTSTERKLKYRLQSTWPIRLHFWNLTDLTPSLIQVTSFIHLEYPIYPIYYHHRNQVNWPPSSLIPPLYTTQDTSNVEKFELQAIMMEDSWNTYSELAHCRMWYIGHLYDFFLYQATFKSFPLFRLLSQDTWDHSVPFKEGHICLYNHVNKVRGIKRGANM